MSASAGGAAYRHVKLVGGDDAELRITDLVLAKSQPGGQVVDLSALIRRRFRCDDHSQLHLLRLFPFLCGGRRQSRGNIQPLCTRAHPPASPRLAPVSPPGVPLSRPSPPAAGERRAANSIAISLTISTA